MYFVYSSIGLEMVSNPGIYGGIGELADDFPDCIYFEAELCTPEERETLDIRSVGKPVYGLCLHCGAIEAKLVQKTGTRDYSAIGESAVYPVGYGCEYCS